MTALLAIWHALSPLGLLLTAGGGAVLIVVALGLFALPSWLSRPLAVVGAVLVIAGLIYQTAYARATHAAELRQERAVAEANQRRAEAAETALAADRERAKADAAQIEALRRETDATPQNPADCLPDDAAERLRRVR